MSEYSEWSSSCRNSGIAPDNFAPAPTSATGFEDCCSRATIVSVNPPSAFASAGRACGVNFTGPENSFFAFSMSVGISITTGPGRPLRAQ